jgi:hypothetical protein
MFTTFIPNTRWHHEFASLHTLLSWRPLDPTVSMCMVRLARTINNNYEIKLFISTCTLKFSDPKVSPRRLAWKFENIKNWHWICRYDYDLLLFYILQKESWQKLHVFRISTTLSDACVVPSSNSHDRHVGIIDDRVLNNTLWVTKKTDGQDDNISLFLFIR